MGRKDEESLSEVRRKLVERLLRERKSVEADLEVKWGQALDERDDARAEVERLTSTVDVMARERDLALGRAKKAEAELARYGKLPPLADGEEYVSVGWWRGLDAAERERLQCRWPSRSDLWIEQDPAPSIARSEVIVVRAKPQHPAPEPTVEVKARDLRAGMREHGTGRTFTVSACIRSKDGAALAYCPTWLLDDSPKRYEPEQGWVAPDAVYEIDVDSLPDGWAPSGEGE